MHRWRRRIGLFPKETVAGPTERSRIDCRKSQKTRAIQRRQRGGKKEKPPQQNFGGPWYVPLDHQNLKQKDQFECSYWKKTQLPFQIGRHSNGQQNRKKQKPIVKNETQRR